MITREVMAYTERWGMAGFAVCLKHNAKNPEIIDEYIISTRRQENPWQATVKCGNGTLAIDGNVWLATWCQEHQAPMVLLHVNRDTVAISFDKFGIHLLNGHEHDDVYLQGD